MQLQGCYHLEYGARQLTSANSLYWKWLQCSGSSPMGSGNYIAVSVPRSGKVAAWARDAVFWRNLCMP